jgi:hypothetical protein
MGMTLALVRSDAEIEGTIAAVAPADGLLAIPDSFTYVRRPLITARAANHHLLPFILSLRVLRVVASSL